MTIPETIAKIKQIFMEVCNNKQPEVVKIEVYSSERHPELYRCYIHYYNERTYNSQHIYVGYAWGSEYVITNIDQLFEEIRLNLLESGIA